MYPPIWIGPLSILRELIRCFATNAFERQYGHESKTSRFSAPPSFNPCTYDFGRSVLWHTCQTASSVVPFMLSRWSSGHPFSTASTRPSPMDRRAFPLDRVRDCGCLAQGSGEGKNDERGSYASWCPLLGHTTKPPRPWKLSTTTGADHRNHRGLCGC